MLVFTSAFQWTNINSSIAGKRMILSTDCMCVDRYVWATDMIYLSLPVITAADVAKCHIQERAKLHRKPLSLSSVYLFSAVGQRCRLLPDALLLHLDIESKGSFVFFFVFPSRLSAVCAFWGLLASCKSRGLFTATTHIKIHF